MKIVQTFWSAGKSPLRHNFGWFSAQHHIMSWALSCLKIKEYYDDVELYTDSNGYDILVNCLKLPYSSVHCCYDSFEYQHPHLWALPKVKTYAAQTSPFIHIDGDVFIWEKFSFQLESAPLIAQNFEKGTSYYGEIMAGLKEKLRFIPGCLRVELAKPSVSAYNAGILGGSDYLFFKEYAETAIEFIGKNSGSCLSSNMNVLFEQVLFYVMSRERDKTVSCLLSGQIEDNGYSQRDFGDFTAVPYRLKYLHLIGSNKRNKVTCDMMSRTLLLHYPEYFYRIVSLFRGEHAFWTGKIEPLFSFWYPSGHHFPKPACRDENFAHSDALVLPSSSERWHRVAPNELYMQELAAISYSYFFFCPQKEQLQTVIAINPHLTVTEAPESERSDYNVYANEAETDTIAPCAVVSLPELFFEGISNIAIDELGYNILAILDTPRTVQNIIISLASCFSVEDLTHHQRVIYDLVLTKLKFLFHHKCIFICSKP